MPLISVITICYNDPDIQKTCESIVNQSYQDFEWVVIDGGSNKETIEVLIKYKDRINIFVSEKDGGVYNAMNKGIRLASGEYLHFLNAGDCYFDEHSLSNIVAHLGASDIVFGDLKFLQKDGEFIKKYPDNIPYGWLKTDSLPHPASFIKRELFDKYGLYNEKNKIVSDWEKWIEFIDVHKSSYTHLPFVVSVHNYNGISSVFNEEHFRERAQVESKYYGTSLFKIKAQKLIRAVKRRVVNVLNLIFKNG